MFRKRLIVPSLLDALKISPVVFLSGARQVGKSTLANNLAMHEYPADYMTLDNPTMLAAASSNPQSFLQREQPLIIDEVQLAPELFRPLKSAVDQLRLQQSDNCNGRYLLTGSANIMAFPKLSDALVGRMTVRHLYPYSAVELFGKNASFLEALFSNSFTAGEQPSSDISLLQVMKQATFPEISDKKDRMRNLWFEGYISTLLQRDVRLLSEIEKLGILPNMLNVLASRVGGLVNESDIGRALGLNSVTTKKYRTLLQMMFLTNDIKPWYRNIGKRLVKSAKSYISDVSLLCYLLDVRLDDLPHRNPSLFGHILENFVAVELTKQLSFTDHRASLYHFRTSDNKEVDFVLELPNGKLAAIEVKSTESVSAKDFKGLKVLQALTGDDLISGIVLYQGKDIVPFGEKLWAVPVDMLWLSF